MLVAKLRPTYGASLRAYKPPAVLPCSPKKILRIEVHAAGFVRMFATWCAVHFRDRLRIARWRYVGVAVLALVALAVVASGIAFAQLDHQEVIATAPTQTPTQDDAQYTRQREDEPKRLDSWTTISKDGEIRSRPFLVRTLLITLGTPLVLFSLIAYRLLRAIFRITLIVLAPHEPFPTIEPHIARSRREFVFAIRTQGQEASRRFFDWYLNPVVGGSEYHETRDDGPVVLMTTLSVTHQRLVPQTSRFHPLSYWTLIRFALVLMLPANANDLLGRTYLTYKLHEPLFLSYFFLLAGAVLLPLIGWAPKGAGDQFPLMMAALGFTWLGFFFLLHVGMKRHLLEWERLTARAPFLGCPIYHYSQLETLEGGWNHIDASMFEGRISDFGVDFDRLQQIIVTTMLGLYLAVVVIIK